MSIGMVLFTFGIMLLFGTLYDFIRSTDYDLMSEDSSNPQEKARLWSYNLKFAIFLIIASIVYPG